jgi:hypothetical protein
MNRWTTDPQQSDRRKLRTFADPGGIDVTAVDPKRLRRGILLMSNRTPSHPFASARELEELERK